jgi:hypothetical protein
MSENKKSESRAVFMIFGLMYIVGSYFLSSLVRGLPSLMSSNNGIEDKIWWINSTIIQSTATLLGFLMVVIVFLYHKDAYIKMPKYSIFILGVVAVVILFCFIFSSITMASVGTIGPNSLNELTYMGMIMWYVVILFVVTFFIISLVALWNHV